MTIAKNRRLACLIVARNFGDAAIQSEFLKSLVEGGYARQYLIWTRPQFAFFFKISPDCEVVCSQFPVGTRKQFGAAEIWRFLKAVKLIRKRRPDVTIDLVGDVRERLLARLLSSREHLHIGWAEGHPFNRMIRNHLGRGHPVVTVPVSVPNVYHGHRLMLDVLMPNYRAEGIVQRRSGCRGLSVPARVGLHPFASQKHRMWPSENWRQVAQALIAQGMRVYAFGAPADRQALTEVFGKFGDRVHMVTETMESFAKHLSRLDVLVGMNSFAVHMAWREGTRTVMINGPTPEELWSVPSGGRVLASSGGCPHYPCFDVPRCEGCETEYICVRCISVEAVLQAVESLLEPSCAAEHDAHDF